MAADNERRSSGRSSSQGPSYASPYEFTKTGTIGDQRDTMLQSELQILVSSPPDLLGFLLDDRLMQHFLAWTGQSSSTRA